LAIVTAALIGVGAAWLLFANADGARMSSQLLSLAGLQLPVEQGRPDQTPTVQPSTPRPLPAAPVQPVQASSPQPRPSPSPSADPGRPI
jgi:hypothetical protein